MSRRNFYTKKGVKQMEYVFKLIHNRKVEEPDIYNTFLIGFYSKRENAEKTIERFRLIDGFKDFPNDFYIEKERVDEGIVDEDGALDKLASVFFLSHTYEEGEYDFDSYLGVFSSLEKVQKELSYLKNLPEYKEHQNDFHIDEYKLDEDNWVSGFLN